MKKTKFKKLLSKMTMFDDSFMSVCFDNNIPLATLLLKIILTRDDIVVTEVKSQYNISTIKNKNCRLDVKMKDSKGKVYDVEIQNKNSGASPERARYYSSILDTKISNAGENIKNLAETYIIFITKNDYYKKGLPLYKIDRYINTKNDVFENFNDGSHIIYVNGSYRGKDDIGYLMRDFNERKPCKMHFDEVKKITKDTKEGIYVGGRNGMSDLWENALKEERAEGKAEGKAEGMQQGKRELLNKLVKKGILTKEEAEVEMA